MAAKKKSRRKRNPDLYSAVMLPGVLQSVDKFRRGLGRKRKAGKPASKKRHSKRNPKRNPKEAARAAYEGFHGRPSEQWVEIVTPIHEHSVVAGLGELTKLIVEAQNGGRVTIKNFSLPGRPCLLTMNEARTQLFVDGGDQSVNLADFGIYEPYHETETLGKVRNVYYYTVKDHLGDEGGEATYNHKFGGMREVRVRGKLKRKRSPLPDLIYDVRNKLLHFSGGGYTLPDEGIAN